MAKMPFLPCPEIERLSEQSETSLQVSNVSFATHIGTHVDAACHAVADGKSVEAYDVNRFVTTAVVVEVEVDALGGIPASALEPAEDALARDDVDAVIIRTGWESLIDDDEYYDHPYFTQELADWLVEHGVNWVGMDVLTPDKPSPLREDGFDYPIHTTLLENDVLIVENMTNIGSLEADLLEVAALPTPIVGADGAPMRIAAKPHTDTDTPDN
jgi:kynurenine formamidase